MIIAIDGPAAAGKGTLARKLAHAYDLAYLDTGSLYRAVGLSAIRADDDPENEDRAAGHAQNLNNAILTDPALRDEATGQAASQVAAHPKVRAALLAFQHRFAAQPPDGKRGAVLDGRDIGTVVCPKADLKLFVTASPEERAKRRHAELLAKNIPTEFDAVYQDVIRRDARDAERSASPLVPAADAHLLDTTNLDIEAAFERACALVDRLGEPQ